VVRTNQEGTGNRGVNVESEVDKQASLPEVHGSVQIPKGVGLARRLFAFGGPAYLVSVGYMDPGNWATDIEGGARFGHQLVWVLLMSNLMAVLLQTLSARLGIVTGRDLAQACREHYPKSIGIVLWVMSEIAIAACDLAEVLGTAIGINLLFGLPLVYGVLVTGLDTLLFLAVQQYNIRKIEAFIISFVAIIGVCFGIELFLAKPDWSGVAGGFIPRLNKESLYVAVGILGATVMPHNLYLHSALVQTRAVSQSAEGKRQACRYNLIDTSVALNAAFFINSAILVLAASVFFRRGMAVTEIQQAHSLLAPLLGTAMASTLFAVALIAAGQSSTITGTIAGQIVMEGFLRFKIRPVVRRLITRMIAIVPAVTVIAWKGDEGSYDLLILSQVILSLQLPFAVIPLIKFTGSREQMGSFVNKTWVTVIAWLTAVVIVVLNANLVFQTFSGWIARAGGYGWLLWLTAVPGALAVAGLLVYISLPKRFFGRRKPVPATAPVLELVEQRYRRIGVAVDFGKTDAKVVSHAHTLAKLHKATLVLFHIVEGVSGQIYGDEAHDEEARHDREILNAEAEQLRAAGTTVEGALGFGLVPEQLVALSREHQVDLLVMGAHGHRGLQDILFGTSISEVRHKLDIPVLVVQ
jgi:manganese transport protein